MSSLTLGRLLVVALLAAPALAGCIAPATEAEADPLDAAGAPLTLALPDVITGLEPMANVAFGGGNDLAFEGGYAYVSSSSGVHIVDIRDPENPVEVGLAECNGKDIDVIQFEARRIVVVSSQGDDNCPDAAPAGGIRLIDVTEPARPIVLGQVALKYGSHTMSPYGDSGFIYNSAYDLTNPMAHHRSEIVDVRDPAAPKVAGELMFPADSASPGCHDILTEPSRNRAICAGITETMFWDTTDPAAPKVVSVLLNPAINIHHSAVTARDGDLLIIGDEFGGALAPACNPSGQGPTGALWFYDIKDIQDPKMLGYLPPPAGAPAQVCTAHNFDVIDGRDMMVAAFYKAGTVLVDFSDPADPKLLSQQIQDGTNTWAAYYHNGAVFSGDMGRGLDAYRLV